MAAPEASVHLVRNRLCYHSFLYQTNESCLQGVSRRMMLLISFNKSYLRVTAPNVTEAGHFMNVLSGDFYIIKRNAKNTASAVSFSAILSCEILDSGQQLSVCVRARQLNSYLASCGFRTIN